MSSPQMFESLIASLEQLLAQYAQVYNLAERKRQCLISADLEQLEQTVREETTALAKARTMEKKRLEQTGIIRRELGLAEKELSLNEIIEAADPASRERLRDIQGKFAEVVRKLLQVNKTNSELLETSINYNEMMINMLLGAEDPLNNFYDEDGSQSEERIANPSFFDQQA